MAAYTAGCVAVLGTGNTVQKPQIESFAAQPPVIRGSESSTLYRSEAPAFFGANPWPWVDPATGDVHTLPAKKRFDAGTPNQVP